MALLMDAEREREREKEGTETHKERRMSMLLTVEDALVEVELLVCASLCVVAARDALVTRRTGGSGAPRARPPLHRRLRLLKKRQREVDRPC